MACSAQPWKPVARLSLVMRHRDDHDLFGLVQKKIASPMTEVKP
jgi:hypothetical protein